jgi:hypothetical protein
MKKALLILSILVLFLSAAAPPANDNLVQLTLVNKSGLPLNIQLTSNTSFFKKSAPVTTTTSYLFTLPTGYPSSPTVQSYSILQAKYSISVYYVEAYDPVYGYKCNSPQSYTLTAEHNNRLIILACNRGAVNPGVSPFLKLSNHPSRGKGVNQIPNITPTPIALP